MLVLERLDCKCINYISLVMGIKVNLYIHANEKITCTYFENVITITTFLIIMFILRVSKSHP